MSQNIKNNLFRFVTLRNPQLIEEKDKKTGFIYHPHVDNSEEDSGVFISAIDGIDDKDKKQALIKASDNFKDGELAFEKKADVREFNTELYNFSSWLMRNKNALSYVEIIANSNNVKALFPSEKISVWDNLIYQTISKSSVYVREALIQLLIADKFLEHFIKFSKDLSEDITFTEDQEKEFKRCAFSSVVISKSLLLESYNDTTLAAKSKPANTKHQKRLSDLITAKYHKVVLKKLTNELKDLKKSYDTQEAASYQTALNLHKKNVDAILDNGTTQLVDQWNVEKQEYEKIEKQIYDPLPKFEYQKGVEINPLKLKEKLSNLSHAYLVENKLDTLTSFDAILGKIKIRSKQKSNSIAKLLPKANKSILTGGALMRAQDPFVDTLDNFGDIDANVEQMVDEEILADTIPSLVSSDILPHQIDPSACYTINIIARASALKGAKRYWNFIISITYNNEVTSVTSLEHSLTFINDTNAISSSSYRVSNTSPNHSKIHLFNDLGSVDKPQVGNPILSGTITLANGTQLEFSETLQTIPSLRELEGSEILNFYCKEDEETPEVTPEESVTSFNKIYGVTNLGIADFRRVEQEVCCYVPGEVSHIENVMAREYKERSTRSLLSSEITTERSEESEHESLTDTSTTERNEMQSEVASVLNEDESQSFGASTSVNGTFPSGSYSAGAHFDAASSSSASNSNSQAQMYAQEVTERAMERIVQKTSSKRTSRILREFEENNSHGFDNRKGTDHVTGVYRWVDKIYKNTLINYGKRLMYEFAIPEPSKFFQEAVWKQVDESGQVGSDIILPEAPLHPIEYGLTDSSVLVNITEDDDTEDDKLDYQTIAAHYSAEVSSPPSFNKMTGWEHSFSVTSKDGMARDNSTSLDIPEGYFTVQWGFAQTGLGAGWPNWGISVGNDHHVGVYASEKEIIREMDPFTEKLPIAIYTDTYWGGTVSVNVKLQRSTEYFEQWQNETYNAIMEAYYDRVQEYNEAILANGIIPDGSAEKLTFNPLQNKSIMLREMKRIAIELLIDQTRVSRSNYNDINQDTGVSTVIKSEDLQTHASTVKFFEQAFDWDIMSYIFYPYFYAKEDDWKKLFQSQDAADPLFQAFLQSGMARTVVPVRPGFEDAVNWYMTTREIWNGQGLVTDQEDDLYVSVAEEMQTVDGAIEGTWETRLPTALTVLQAGSIGLNVDGLPCNIDCDDFALFDSDGEPILDDEGNQETENPIASTGTLIGGKEGVGSDAVSQPITVQ